jgi:crotonobetainyl-CoA:carnitine CoA-transferase CaiB-like acyl-CoA transferase
MPWYAIAVGGALLVVGVVALLRRRHEGEGQYGQAGAQAVKLGRLY